MRSLYNEFFYIPKHGKIREKVMLARVAAIIAILIMCLLAMGITAYAWFSCSVTSGSNIIRAANFEAQVTIRGEGENDDVPLTKDGEYQVAELIAGKTYTVTLTAPTNEGAAETGFCVITADGCTKIYHTQQLGVDKSVVPAGETPQIAFDLKVSQDTKIYILSHWGTSSCYDSYKTDATKAELYICNKNTVEITIANATSGISESDEDRETTTSTAGQGSTGQSTLTTETAPPTETTTTPPAEATQPTETTTSETTGTSEPTDTTEPSTSTTEPTTTQPTETSTTETTGTASTEQTQPATETTETTGAPTTQASE